jgi:hypothetical protein
MDSKLSLKQEEEKGKKDKQELGKCRINTSK